MIRQVFRCRLVSCWVVILVCVSVYSQYSEPISVAYYRTFVGSPGGVHSEKQIMHSHYGCSTVFSVVHSNSLSEFTEQDVYCVPIIQQQYELSPMDAEGIVRRPRRIAGGDHDSFGEGEDGEKLPEVGTTKNNPTPIGDVPIAMLICMALCYLLYRYYNTYIKSEIGKK